MNELQRFTRFCAEILGLKLEPFQERIVSEVFSDRREALILLPRGNGKSTLLAAVALWHLLRKPDPRIAIGAASREQAAVLFDIARAMASTPAIASRVEVTRREIRTPAGWLKVVASDGPKQHGLILSLAIVDELHAHREAELYTALRYQGGDPLRQPEARGGRHRADTRARHSALAEAHLREPSSRAAGRPGLYRGAVRPRRSGLYLPRPPARGEAARPTHGRAPRSVRPRSRMGRNGQNRREAPRPDPCGGGRARAGDRSVMREVGYLGPVAQLVEQRTHNP
jgi:terminase large subunit-like protein